MKLLQIWQYGLPAAAETGLDEAIATAKQFGFDGLAVKVLDGVDWMDRYDGHVDALTDLDELRAQTERAHAAGLELWGWVNPLAIIPAAQEGALYAQVAEACDGLLLDAEPYRQFWGAWNPVGQAHELVHAIRSGTSKPIVLQPDPRDTHLAELRVDEWMEVCDAIAGQHYWQDFQTDPRAELAHAQQLGARFGKPVYPTLPGNADPSAVPVDLVAEFPGFVVWRLGSTGPAMLHVLGAIAVTAPAPPAPEPEPTVSRETPDDFPFPDWRQSAIAYRGALEDLGHQVDTLTASVATARAERDAALKGTPQLMDDLTRTRGQLQEVEARIATALTALGGKAA